MNSHSGCCSPETGVEAAICVSECWAVDVDVPVSNEILADLISTLPLERGGGACLLSFRCWKKNDSFRKMHQSIRAFAQDHSGHPKEQGYQSHTQRPHTTTGSYCTNSMRKQNHHLLSFHVPLYQCNKHRNPDTRTQETTRG